ncbi:MAG: lipocalin family protein [Candidatus Aminicenantes bacterium]|nr:lipocalin family protein [Candidatus Aminicenantes bacterium]
MKTIVVVLSAVCLAAAVSGASGGQDKPPLQTVPSVDLARYMGTWYEIAAFPQKFQKGCHCTKATYEMTEKDYVRVINSCRKDSAQGKEKTAKGKAFIVEGTGNSKLKVQFFWPFRGDYWIIELAEDYSHVVVGAPDRDYLWILARTPKIDEALYKDIVARCAEKDFDVSRLVMTDQSCAGR